MYGNGFTVTNVYDSLDRLVEVKHNNSTAYTVYYNGDGAVSRVVDNKSGITTDYEYDSLGRLIRAEEYATASGASLLKTQNNYDAYGRPQSSVYTLPGQSLHYTVNYQANSNRIDSYFVNEGNGLVASGK